MSGIKRVVVACGDPDPRVSGRGFSALKAAGVDVAEGVLCAEAERVNRGFLKRHREGLPMVTLKLATTLDARIATATGESQWTSRPHGKYWSIAANGSRLLVLDERGRLMMLDANPQEFKLLDTRQLGDSTAWAHIAAADDQVFVRELDGLTMFRWQ